MPIREITAKSLLRKHKSIDSWFVTCYGMNLYRGCTHNCSYCDGRAEKYQVDGEFGNEVAVKTNAIELLTKELDPARKRKPMKRSFMMLGGGVGDAYQPAEEQYGIARQVLELLYSRAWPVHILTKSVLVERDLDILKKIDLRTRAMVSFSFSTVDEKIASVFEPGVPPPARRLETVRKLKSEGLTCGMFLMPVIPFISDTPQQMDACFRAAKDTDIDFIIFGGMTLKDGRQKDHYLKVLTDHYPDKVIHYHNIYKRDKWGMPSAEYHGMLDPLVLSLSKRYRIPLRIPSRYYKDILSENDRVMVMLNQMDYILKLSGAKSPYGYAAYKLSKLKNTVPDLFGNVRKVNGIGPATERIIREIQRTGSSRYYEKLILNR